MSNYCPKCGAQTRPNARFCGGCGHDMSQSAPTVQSPPPSGYSVGPAPLAPQQYTPPANPQPYQSPAPAYSPAQSWPGAYSAVQPAPSVVSPVDPGGKSLTERKVLLAQHVQHEVAKGGRVESQNDTSAVMIYGKPVNHVLHFLITLFTVGLWLFVWMAVAIFGGEKRKMVVVDEFGNVQVQKV